MGRRGRRSSTPPSGFSLSTNRIGSSRRSCDPSGVNREGSMSSIRLALRTLAHEPAFATVVIVTLALGIGANTAIFTLFNAILLQPLPVRDPTLLVLFSGNAGEGTSTGTPPTGRWELFSTEAYDFLRRQSLPFESIA